MIERLWALDIQKKIVAANISINLTSLTKQVRLTSQQRGCQDE